MVLPRSGTTYPGMMTFWLFASLLTAAAVIFALWPLIRGAAPVPVLEQAVAFYEARKAELIRQREAGEISAAECEAALAEQGRALLALSRAGTQAAAPDSGALRRRKLAALAMLALVPVLALGLYLRIGAPALPDLPLAARKPAPQNLDVAGALQRIEAHLAKNPNDGRGFEVVAPVYLRAGRFADAAQAYRRTVELLGESPERLADLGESLVAELNGMISAEARQAFERALVLDAGFAKSRFYLAIAREQDGDVTGALAELRRLEAALPEGPSRMRVRAEIERFQAEGKAPAAGPQGEAGPGTDRQAIASLPAADRDAAIRGMVEALDARLADKGGTIREWQRLVQARLVLGQDDLAAVALAKAREALAGDAAAREALDALAAMIKNTPEKQDTPEKKAP